LPACHADATDGSNQCQCKKMCNSASYRAINGARLGAIVVLPSMKRVIFKFQTAAGCGALESPLSA